LQYVFNGKTPLVRLSGAQAKGGSSCTDELHGMDCSGLIFNVAEVVGIGIVVGKAITQQSPDAWKIPPEWSLRMVVVTDGTIQTGDIVGWADHIGIVEEGGSDPIVISSIGGANSCAKNKIAPYGPVAKTRSWLKLTPPQTVLRLAVSYEGSYSGTFVGGDQGTFEVNIDREGAISGTGDSGQDGLFGLAGSVSARGDLLATTGSTTLASTFSGSIDTSHIPFRISGTWNNPAARVNGTFAGVKH